MICRCEEYKKMIMVLSDEIQRLKKIELEGWQGTSGIEIEREGQEYLVVERRKDKNTREISNVINRVHEINVANVWTLIKARTPTLMDKTKSREIALDIITQKGLAVTVDEFWGGKYRKMYLFPMLYYPLKILERKGFIRYGGRGSIVRLK